MTRFSRFSKSALWTQFLIGILAVFALPALSNQDGRIEREIVEQQVIRLSSQTQGESERVFFLQQDRIITLESCLQAVEFCIFSAKLYRLESYANPPIRAGPRI